MKRVVFIASTGGHLNELLQLKKIFDNYDYMLITEKTKSNLGLKKTYGKRVSFLIYGSKDHLFSYLFKFTANSFLSIYYYFKFRPKYIVTTGTHTAVPLSYISKLFGCKIIYIETFANIYTPTKTGVIMYKIADLFIVQWKELLVHYPNAKYFGGIY